MERKRDERLDIIRIFSLLCVISVHFLLNSGFYEQDVYGKRMLAMCIYRSLFIICVPMFITLTGYLMNKKELNLKYYKGIIKVLVVYFICSVIYAVFEKLYLKENITIRIFIKNILSFAGTKYSWYIEMYTGLFLLIPFLNLIFNNLKDKKQTQVLLLTLVMMIGIPAVVNIFKFYSIDWWKSPATDNSYVKLLPSWWTTIYPIFYYFLGAYLNKYTVKVSKMWNIIFVLIMVFLDGIFNYYRSYGSKFIWGEWNTYYSAIVMLTTFLVFNLLLKIRFKSVNKFRSKILKTLSNASLGAYLISCVFDIIYYDKLKNIIQCIPDRFKFAPLMIIIVFISSVLTSIMINILYSIIKKTIKYIITKIKMMNIKHNNYQYTDREESIDGVKEKREKIHIN